MCSNLRQTRELCYLKGTIDLGLYFSYNFDKTLVGYSDANYLSDPHNAGSYTGFVFLYGDTAISWGSIKQTMVATSSNHFEILLLHEASRECIWLRSIIGHICHTCQISSINETPLCCLKIMQLALHKLTVDISRVTE